MHDHDKPTPVPDPPQPRPQPAPGPTPNAPGTPPDPGLTITGLDLAIGHDRTAAIRWPPDHPANSEQRYA